MTTDVDVTVDGASTSPREVLDLLEPNAIVSRIPHAIAFAEANLVLLLRHEPSGVNVDLSFAWTAFQLAGAPEIQDGLDSLFEKIRRVSRRSGPRGARREPGGGQT